MGEKMDRGTDLMKGMLSECQKMEIRHARRGWCQECICCITKSDFKYYDTTLNDDPENNSNKHKVAVSKEEFNFCCRCCIGPCHSFDMTVKAPSLPENQNPEIIEVNRPCRLPMCTCKCCCYQEATVFSGDDDLGEVREAFWCCIPKFKVYDHDDKTVYIIKPPTCCGGMCIDCCTEGAPCPHGCLMLPWRVYSADASRTNGDAPYVGKMLKIPKATFRDTFNETSYVELQFPDDADAKKKGLLLGAYLLINALFFEHSE
ncbi:unnamed protein product [Cylindrotheca closterium]|uniref:Phospholipid scramblase n=1 Tax=Cylindrotheca closterium TaxID=2856 RepID=A0AAD2CFE5_9STRA|nr:unnamed protein product [Cylindrotheca closterium]